MSFFHTLASGLFWTFSLSGAALAADHTSRVAERIPGDACVAIFSDDVAATCEAFRKTRLGAKLCGAAFAPLVAELTKREIASFLHMRPAFGFDWSDLAKVHDPGGLAMFPLADGSLGSGWIFTPLQPLRETPPAMAAAAKYFNEKGYRGSTVQAKGVNLTLFHPPHARKSEPPRVLFVSKTYYGVANSQTAADAIIAIAPDASLGKQGRLAKLAAQVSAGDSAAADVNFAIRPFELWELVARARDKENEKQLAGAAKQNATGNPTDEKPAEDALVASRRLGLSAIQAAAGCVRFAAAEPCEWTIDAALEIARPYRGALRLLEFRPGPLAELPTWIQAGVVSAGQWRWDFPLAMKGFGNLYDQANEPGPDGDGLFEDLLDGLRDDPEGVRVDLRRDLFGQLTPDMLRISDEGGTPAKTKGDARRWLYVAGVRDMPSVLDALTRFYRGDKRVSRLKAGDFDVWTVGENASLFVEGESDSLVTVRGLALGRNQLIFSTDLELLNSAIAPQAGAKSLADDADWSRLLAWISPRENEAAAFQSLARIDRVLGASYELGTAAPVQEKPAAEPDEKRQPPEPLAARLWRLLLFGDARGSDELPYAAAPKFDVLREALPPAGIVMSQSGDGWVIRFGVLGPAKDISP